jgi:cutinase
MTTAPSPPVLIITARGSTEPASGSRLLTPIAQTIAQRYPGDVRILSLAYPATFTRFDPTFPARIDLGPSPAIGVRNLVAALHDQAATRPEQRIVLLGWSQGAQVITDTLAAPHHRRAGHDAPALNRTAARLVHALALFGNPTFTAGQPHNAGEYAPGVSGVTPHHAGALEKFTDRIRDYCTLTDIAAQNAPGSDVDGHAAYFHNGMPDQSADFVLDQLSRTPSSSHKKAHRSG